MEKSRGAVGEGEVTGRLRLVWRMSGVDSTCFGVL